MAVDPTIPAGAPIETPNTPTPPNIDLGNQIAKSYPRAEPAIKAAAIQTNDPTQANALGAVGSVSPMAQAINDHLQTYNSRGWFQNILNDTKDVATTVMGTIGKIPVIGTLANWANKPLQEIQKDYKFIHSLWADQGAGAGILGTIGVLAGGTIGFLGGGLEGASIGASAAGALERNILGRVIPNYKSSFDKSNDPTYNVSFGRDLAHGLSNVPGFGTLSDTSKGFGQLISGIADASLDLTTDPLARVGNIYGKIKGGDYLAEAKTVDETGKTVVMRDENNNAIMKATLPIASRFPQIENMLKSMAPSVQTSDQLMTAYANPLNWQFRGAVKDIAKTKDPVALQVRYGNMTTPLANALAKANTEPAVLNIFGQSMFSHEFAQGATPTGSLVIPTRTLGKIFSNSFGAEKILQKYGSTVNEEKNFLLPKRQYITEPEMEPVLDPKTQKPIINPDGTTQMKQTINAFGKPSVKIQTDIKTGEALYKINRPVWASKDSYTSADNVMNALAGKVRTFTGMKALSMNQELMKQSADKIDFSDPNAGITVYNMLHYSLPSNVAKEYATKIMTLTNDNDRRALLRAGYNEVIKAAGLPASDGMLNKILSQVHRATFGNEITNGVYGFDEGEALGNMKDAEGNNVNAALDPSQRFLGSMLDLKELHTQMRAAKAYGVLYNHADDFFTHYTNKIFAPLTLLSTGFGFRVAGAEALHQIIRKGLGSYIGNLTEDAAGRYGYQQLLKGEKSKTLDAVMQALTPEEWAKLDKPNDILTENDVTKNLSEREKNFKAIYQAAQKAIGSKAAYNSKIQEAMDLKARIHPLGWLADQYVSSKIAPYSVRQKAINMLRFHLSVGSEGLTDGIAADHGASALSAARQNVDWLSQGFGHGKKPGEELAGLTEMDPHFNMYWAQNASKLAQSPFHQDIAKDFLNIKKEFPNMSNDDIWNNVTAAHVQRINDKSSYAEYRGNMDGLSQATPQSFGSAQVAQLRGITKGADKTVHTDILNNIAIGKNTMATDLLKIDNGSKPIMILGRRARPTMDNPLQRAEEVGYRTFVNPIMDFISRQPLFAHHFNEAMKDSDTMKAKGLVDEDQAVRIAALRATEKMLPTIHNPALRSQFATLHRNLMPFYFAQEQAMKRTGRLLMSDPQAFRDFQMINQGLNNPGFVHTDANGKKYIVYPMAGELGNSLTRGLSALGITPSFGLPTSITGTTSSLATVLPDVKVPGISTFGNIALEELSKRFPVFSGLSNVASGGFPPTTLKEALIPNSAMRDVFDAMTMDQTQSNVINSINSAVAAAYYHGDLIDGFTSLPAADKQAIMDKIENNARSNLLVKGIAAFFLPLSPSVSNDYYDKNLQSFRSEYLNLLNTVDKTTGKNYTLAAALQKFLGEHGSRAVSYTVGSTNDLMNGANPSLSAATSAWMNNNKDLMSGAYGNAAGYLMPQGTSGGNISKLENRMIQLGLRSRKTPQDFLDSVYVASGWSDVNDIYQGYLQYVKNARNTGNTQAVSQATAAWNAYAQNYSATNPTWFEDYSGISRVVNADKVLSSFEALQKDGKMPTDAQGAGILSLLNDYNAFKPMLAATTVNNKTNTAQRSQLLNVWSAYLDSVAAEKPNLVNVINGVFRRVTAKL
jgi:hypothetical protein